MHVPHPDAQLVRLNVASSLICVPNDNLRQRLLDRLHLARERAVVLQICVLRVGVEREADALGIIERAVRELQEHEAPELRAREPALPRGNVAGEEQAGEEVAELPEAAALGFDTLHGRAAAGRAAADEREAAVVGLSK